MRTFGSFLPTSHLATTGPVTVRCARRSADAPPAAAGRADAFVVKSYEALDADRPELFWVPDAEAGRAAFLASVRRQVRMAAAAPRQWLAVHEQGDGPVPYYAADFVGLSLRKLVIWRTQLRHYALLHIVRSVVDALWELRRNDAGGTHGNLKLTNVLLDGDGTLEQVRVRLADPHGDPKFKGELDELHDVGRLIESLVLRRDAFAGLMSFEDRRPWDALGGRDGARWRDLCSRLRDGECATLGQLREVELRRFTTRGRVLLRRTIGTAFAGAGVGAVVFMGVSATRFTEAKNKLVEREKNLDYIGRTFDELYNAAPLSSDDPTLAQFFALQPRVKALGESRKLLAGRLGELSIWRDYAAVRRAAEVRVAFDKACAAIAGWEKPAALQKAFADRTGGQSPELTNFKTINGYASDYQLVDLSALRLVMQYDEFLARCDAYRTGTGEELLTKEVKDLSLEKLEARLADQWKTYVERVRGELAGQLLKLNFVQLPLPDRHGRVLDELGKDGRQIGPAASAAIKRLREEIRSVEAADAELAAAVKRVPEQQGDPLLDQLPALLKALLFKHVPSAPREIDLVRFAATCHELAASDAWKAIAGPARVKALEAVDPSQTKLRDERAAEIRDAFQRAPTAAAAMAALAEWPEVLTGLARLDPAQVGTAQADLFDQRLAKASEDADAAPDPAAGRALRDRIDEGKVLRDKLRGLPAVAANAGAIKALRDQLASVNEDIERLAQPIRTQRESAAAAAQEAQRQRDLERLNGDRARQQELARQQEAERQRALAIKLDAEFTQNLGESQAQLAAVPALAARYAAIGKPLKDQSARDWWAKDVGRYLRELAAVGPPKLGEPAFDEAAAAKRAQVLAAEVEELRKRLDASPDARRLPPNATARMDELMAPWVRSAQGAIGELKALDAQLNGDREVRLEDLTPSAERVRGTLRTLGIPDDKVPALTRLDVLKGYRDAATTAERVAVVDSIIPHDDFNLAPQAVPTAWRALVEDNVDLLFDPPKSGGDVRAARLLALLPDKSVRDDLIDRLVRKVAATADERKAAERWVALANLGPAVPAWARYNGAVAALKLRSTDAAVDAGGFDALRKLAGEPDKVPEAAKLLAAIVDAQKPPAPAGGAMPALVRDFKLPGSATGFALKIPVPGGRQEDLRVEFVQVGENRYVSATEVPVLLLQALEAADVPKQASAAPLEYPFVDKAKADSTWGPVTWTPMPAAGGAGGTRPVRIGGASGWWVSSPMLKMVISPAFVEFDNKPNWKSPLTFLSAVSARAVAERLGFGLPTSADWQALSRLAGAGDFRRHAPLYNLRDAMWQRQSDAVRASSNAGTTENNHPSRHSYSPGGKSSSYPFNDGALFFTDVDKGPVDGGFWNLVGNVAEYVADPGPGGTFTYSIVGGSALSEPAADVAAMTVKLDARQEGVWTSRADVGFRLAFTAAPAAADPAGGKKPGEIIRGARFLDR